MRNVLLALNICTYKRRTSIEKNIKKLLLSDFFNDRGSKYYGKMHIFVIDNGSELPTSPSYARSLNTSIMPDSVNQHQSPKDYDRLHIFHNQNTGGSGGFQRGIEEIRKYSSDFSHVIFMDDDVEFEMNTFYILFDYLSSVSEKYLDNPVAGRMFCLDRPDIQYTAAEIWNGGKINHVEYMRNIADGSYIPGRVIYDSGADYGGWWFCCFSMKYVADNDIIPFFIHCDDVEYGLRCGKTPVIIEGVHVWHATYDKRITPIINYYDTRNPLFVNEIHNCGNSRDIVLKDWKAKITAFHIDGDFLSEYYVIRGLWDYMKGMKWLNHLNGENYNQKLLKSRSCRLKNAIFWRITELRFKRKYYRSFQK